MEKNVIHVLLTQLNFSHVAQNRKQIENTTEIKQNSNFKRKINKNNIILFKKRIQI